MLQSHYLFGRLQLKCLYEYTMRQMKRLVDIFFGDWSFFPQSLIADA